MTSNQRKIPTGFMTVRDAADAIGCVPMTISRMFRRGELTRYKEANGYNVLVSAAEVEKIKNFQPVPVPTVVDQPRVGASR